MSFIEFKNVTREYKVGESTIKALDQVSFTVEKGEFTIILGPSGSGKSTTLNLLGGMDQATSGTIKIGKRQITDLNQKELTIYRRHDIGFVFQFYNLIPSLTAIENIDIACRLSHSPLSAKEAIEAVGLSKRADNYPAQLSGGELQRISIARAICKNPQLLLCDEPTGALDSETGKRILTLLQSMAKKYNNAVVVVTHNAAIAPTADRLIKLKDGQVIEDCIQENPIKMEEVEC
jgi:putative ABC transport system ATP-binding protein